MTKPLFDIIGYRKRLGLTQDELGELCNLSDPGRAVRAWEEHQRSDGKVSNGPGPSAVRLMEKVEALWMAYHLAGRNNRRELRAILPKKLIERKPRVKANA